MWWLLLFACTQVEVSEGPTEGTIRALSYNVAGLPEPLSSSEPVENHPHISPLLNQFDLVLVQEDFAYHDLLVADVTLPYRSRPMRIDESERGQTDGLNRFGVHPFDAELTRRRWRQCAGFLDGASDCLADKGFSYQVHTLAEGAELHVVNLHADAGGDPDSTAARADNFVQLAEFLNETAPDAALLIGGDTNCHVSRPDDRATLQTVLAALNAEDVCWALDCGEEHIDRFFFRSGGGVTLTATDWQVDRQFVHPTSGADLSDHPAIAVSVDWAL